MSNYTHDEMEQFFKNVQKGRSVPLSFADKMALRMSEERDAEDPINLHGPKGKVSTSDLTKETLKDIGTVCPLYWRQKNDTKKRHKNVVKQKIPDTMGFSKLGVLVAAEIKSGNDTLSDGQIEWLETAHKNGCIVYVIRRFQDIQKFKERILNSYQEHNEIHSSRDDSKS